MGFHGTCPWTPESDLGVGWVNTNGDNALDVDTITMMTWVNPHTCAFTADRMIMMNKEYTYEVGIQKDTCKLQAAFSPCWRWWGSYVIPTNQWTHIAVAFDGTNQIHYVNGEEVERTTCGSGGEVLLKNDEDFKIGARGGDSGTGATFDGELDDSWLFDTALEGAEVRQWYNTFIDYSKYNDLVGHWRLDGNAQDSSSHGHHGVAISPDWVTGKNNQAFHLNGADEIDIEDNSNNPLDVDTVTMMGWVNPHTCSITSDRAIIMNKEKTYEYGLKDGNCALQAAFSPCWRWWGTKIIPTDTWTHVAIVYDGLNQIHYINGAEVERTTCGSGGNLLKNDEDLKIGARGGDGGTGSSAFDGDIDEAMLFSRGLDSAEVWQHYADTIGMAKTQGLVGHWPLDGDGNDDSGNAHHGTAVGTPEWVTGKIGQAFRYNGLDEVDIPDSTTSPLDVSSLSAFMWINPHTCAFTADRGILFNKESTYEMGLEKNTCKLQAALSPCWIWWGTNVIPLDRWTWVGMTYEQSTGTHTLYINGQPVETQTCGSGGPLTNNNQDLKIGARGGDGTTSSGFNGDLDEFWLFNEFMTADEMHDWYYTLTHYARQQGIIAHYPLDGDGQDQSANANHGTPSDPVWVDGKVQQGLRLNGDDEVNIPDSATTDPDTITISMWVNPHSYPPSGSTNMGILINKENQYEIGLSPVNGYMQSALAPCWRWWGTVPVPLNRWTFITMVYDGVNEIHYQNGVETERTTCGSGGEKLGNTAAALKLGARGSTTGASGMSGDIDDVWILDHYLDSVGVMQQYMDAIGSGSMDHVIGHWKLDGNGLDSSANGIDGVVNNGAYVAGKIDDALHLNGDDYVVVSDSRGVRSTDFRWSCRLTADCVVVGTPAKNDKQRLMARLSQPKFRMGRQQAQEQENEN